MGTLKHYVKSDEFINLLTCLLSSAIGSHMHLEVRVELGSGLTPDLSHTRPADVLVLNWERGKHATFDITVTSPLTPSIPTATSLSEGARGCSRGGRVQKAQNQQPQVFRSWDGCASHLQWSHMEIGTESPKPFSTASLPTWP